MRLAPNAPSRIAIGFLLATWPAHAYRTAADLEEVPDDGIVRWESARVEYEVTDALPADVSAADTLLAIETAFAPWVEADCAEFSTEAFGITSVHAQRGDGRNTLSWVFSAWEDRGFTSDEPAITDVQYAEEDGEWHIVEADVYLNGEFFTWTTSGVLSSGILDITSVLRHEVGHVLGLLHPCELGGADGAPDCTASRDAQSSVMYPMGLPPMDLSDDDRAALCFLYPNDADGDVAGEGGTGGAGPFEAWEEALPVVESAVTGCESDECAARGELGDLCTEHEVCLSGRCAPDAYCTAPCLSDADCPDGGTCVLANGTALCESPLGAFADPCDDSADCMGKQCVSLAELGPVCTRTCDVNPDCPANFTCQEVAGRAVCAPPAGDRGCSCSLPRPAQPTGTPWAAAVAFAALSHFARPRRRPRALPSPRNGEP